VKFAEFFVRMPNLVLYGSGAGIVLALCILFMPQGRKREKFSLPEADVENKEEVLPEEIRIADTDAALSPLTAPEEPADFAEVSVTRHAEMGFDRVYTLIDQALNTIETSENVMPVPRYYSNMEELPDASGPYDGWMETKNPVEKVILLPAEPNSEGADGDEPHPDSPVPGTPASCELKWLYLCFFALMVMGDMTASLLFTELSGADCLPGAWGMVLTLLGSSFALMGLSCCCALVVRFAALHRPMARGKSAAFGAILSVASGICLFSSGVLFFFSALPDVTVMRGCALAAALYLSYRTLTYPPAADVSSGDAESAVAENIPGMEEPPRRSDADDEVRERRIFEGVLRRAVEIFEEMERVSGTTCALDTLKNKAFEALSREGAGRQILQAKEAVEDPWPDCFVLRLSGRILLGLVRTGRYHIGRGFLSAEGEDLVNLFRYVGDEQLRLGCGSLDETKKMAGYMRRSIEDLG
jgi:hypothetical protein